MEKQTFEIPKGCSKVTIEQIGNTIVTSFKSEKYTPTAGDCVRVDFTGYVGFAHIKEVCEHKANYHVLIDSYNELMQNDWYDSAYDATQLTPEELQAEFNKLGYEYNFETHEATKIRWKPRDGEIYYYVSTGCKVIKAKNDNCYGDIELIKIGNCYRTPEEAEPRRQHYLAFKD